MKKVSCDICPNETCLIKRNFITDKALFIEDEKYQAFYKKDHAVFCVGDPISGLYFVQNGMIKEFILRPHNDVEIVRFADEGKVFGRAGFEKDFYTFGADAKVDSVVCYFSNDALNEMYTANPKLLYEMMLFFSNENDESTYRLICLSQMNLREKIASVLYYLFENFGLNGDNELLECFTRDDIASLACTNAEQVSRQLSDFQKEGIIDKRARKIAILKPQKLKDIIKDYLVVSNS